MILGVQGISEAPVRISHFAFFLMTLEQLRPVFIPLDVKHLQCLDLFRAYLAPRNGQVLDIEIQIQDAVQKMPGPGTAPDLFQFLQRAGITTQAGRRFL